MRVLALVGVPFNALAIMLLVVARTLVPLGGVLAAALLLLAVLLSFPTLRTAISGQPAVDRALLPLAPALCVFIVAAFRELAERWRTARARYLVTAKGVSAASPAAAL